MKVFVTRKIPEIGINMLKEKGIEVVISTKNAPLTKDELKAELSKDKYDGVLSLLTDEIDKDIFEASPSTKIYANYAVGFNNINVSLAKEKGIVVTNTPGGSTESVAEHTMALILALSSRIVECDKFVREGKYTGWDPMLFWGANLGGQTLGIIGCGRIGSRVAQIAMLGFGMNIIYYDICKNESIESDLGARKMPDIDSLLKEADFVSLNVALTEDSKHLINEKNIKLMKKSAYLVNTSRGPVIDEVALVNALKNGVIAGAGLDVFEFEPKLTVGLVDLDNVVLTPHIASATKKSRESMSKMAALNLIAFYEGKEVPNKVN